MCLYLCVNKRKHGNDLIFPASGIIQHCIFENETAFLPYEFGPCGNCSYVEIGLYEDLNTDSRIKVLAKALVPEVYYNWTETGFKFDTEKGMPFYSTIPSGFKFFNSRFLVYVRYLENIIWIV